MTKGLVKSSKKKQKLHEKFLKNKTFKNEKAYKKYKNLFERIKQKSKKNHYASLLENSNGNPKKIWDIIKEVTGKKKNGTHIDVPQKLITENGLNICESNEIAEHFNDFFVNVGQKLADKIEPASTNFTSYINDHESEMLEFDLTSEELNKAFCMLKPNKGEGLDEINVNVIKSVFDLIKSPLLYVFNLSLQQGIVPNDLKIARVVPVFKGGDDSLASNYRPISILPCFSKLLERIMYNRLYGYLLQHDILYHKQFGFQKGHSTDHAVVQLADEILKGFDLEYLLIYLKHLTQ